jgi:hypothetical protein
MRAFALSLCAGLLAVLLAAPAAFGMVQLDRGIAGVRLDNTKAQVHAALGRPVKRTAGRNDFGSFLEERYRGGITVFYQGARRVTSVSTTGLGDRTIKGVGVSSRESAVKARVPGVTCETIVGSRSCHTNDFLAGRRVTDFFLKRGRVTRITVGIVID